MDMKKTFLARLTAFIAAATMAVSPVGIDMMSLAVSAEEIGVTVSADETQDGEEPDSDGQESEGSEQKAATKSNSDGVQADIEQHDAENSDAADAANAATEFTVTFDDSIISVYNEDVGNLKNGDTIASGSSVLIGTELDDYVNHRVKVNGEALELTSNGDIYYMNKGYTVTEDTVIEYVEDNWSEEELSKYAVLEIGNNINVYPYGDDPEFGTWTVNHLLSTGNYYPKGSKLAIKVDKYFLEGEKYLSINGEKAEGTVNKDGVFEVIGYTVEDDNVKIAIEGLGSYTVSFDDPNIKVYSDEDGYLENGDVIDEDTCVYIGTTLDNYIDHRMKINGKVVELGSNGDVYYYLTSMYVKENVSIELVEDKWSEDELSKYAVLNVDENIQVYPCYEYNGSMGAVTDYPLSTGNHYPKGKKLVIRAAKDALGENERLFINGEKAEAYLNADNEYQVWGYAVETDTVNITVEEVNTYTVSIKNPELNIGYNGERLTDGAKVDEGAEIYIGTVVDNYIDHRIKVNGEKLDVYPNGDGYIMGNSYTVNGNITVELAEEKWSEAERSNYVVFDIGENINVYPYNPNSNSTDLNHPFATGNYLPKGQSVVIRIANELLDDGKCLLINGSLASGEVNANGEFQLWGYPVNCKENTLTIAVGMAGVSLKNSTTGTSDNFDTLEAAMTYINKNGKANYNYEIVLGHNVEIKKLTLPTASKAASLKILGNGNTVTMGNPSLSVPMNIVLDNVKLESTNTKGYTLTASKNIEMSGFESETLTSLKGSTRSKLIINGAAALTYQVAGFGTAVINGESDDDYYVDVEKPFAVNDLELNSGWLIVRAGVKVTVKNIKSENNSVLMYDDGFTPITINGNVSGKLAVSKCANERFENGQLLIISKTADTSAFDVIASAPDDEYEYVLSRKASNLYIKKVVLKVQEFVPYTYDTVLDEYSFAEWSDLINTINAKKQTNVEYSVSIIDDYDANGSLTMPKAGTYGRIVVDANGHTLTFTGNITLTGNANFSNITLNSVKKVKNVNTPTKFKIAAGKYELDILRSIKAPMLTDITGTGYVGTAYCDLNANISAQNIGLADSKIGGNVTAKNTLSVYGEVSVGKNISALTVASYEDGAKLSVVKGQKFTIGKGGVQTRNVNITLSILDTNGKAYSVPAMGAIATIAGNYAGDFTLSDDCGGDKLTIVKSGKNLVAAETDKLIYMNDGSEKNYSYATLADAMNDITAIGNADGCYEIKITDEAVLTKFPTAKKYKKISFSGGGKIKTASDLRLTGDISLWDITVTKYNAKTKAEDLPINVNVGNYQLMYGENISNVNNISGKGTFHLWGRKGAATISGNINVGRLHLHAADITLGKKSSLTATISAGEEVTIAYYASNASKMKIKDVFNYTNNEEDSSENYALTLRLLDANGNASVLPESKSSDVAVVTGTYDSDRLKLSDENIGETNISLVRSRTKLVTSSSSNIIELTQYYRDENQQDHSCKIGRFDNINNAVAEINRLNNKWGNYMIEFTSSDPVKLTLPKMPLPAAKKYNEFQIVAYNGSVELNITSDIVLTGTLHVDGDITIRKTDRNGNVKPLTVKTGSYNIYGKEHFENATFKVR